MRNGWKLGRIAGIDVTVHWSFAILVGYVALVSLGRGAGLFGAVAELGFIAAAFGCVVLHELGHALAARSFGIRTHGITLLPIGGVANLEAIPRNPFQELVIAIAGPLVNVVIALALLPVMWTLSGLQGLPALSLFGGQFLVRIFYLNVIMIAFNLLPAFPMDGGRVLRAGLAFFRPYLQATQWAVLAGKLMAGLFLAAGLFGNPFLMLIAAFVYFAGEAELQRLRSELAAPLRWPTSWGRQPGPHSVADAPVQSQRWTHPDSAPRNTVFVVPGPDGRQTQWVVRQ